MCLKSIAQLSKVHYIPPLTNAVGAEVNGQYIYISTPSLTSVSFTIIPIGQSPSNYINGSLVNNSPQEVLIDDNDYGQLFIPTNETSLIRNDKGYIIEADGDIYVSIRINASNGYQAAALVSKGKLALGTTFRIGSFTNQNPFANFLNFISIMATEDNTQVSFSEMPSGLIIKNYTGTTPINITLNRGESYVVATNSFDTSVNTDGLIGSLVNSDKPIVVNCGSANGSFHNDFGRDCGMDQIVGLDKVGTEYIFVRGNGADDWENILLIPHKPKTTLSINGGASIPMRYPYTLIEGDQYDTNGNMYIQTSEPVFAYQGIGATNSSANQSLFFVPPLSCGVGGDLDNIPMIDKIGNKTYTGSLNIVTEADAIITINNLPISSFSSTGPLTVAGNTNYVTYRVSDLTGNIFAQSDKELYCSYFNYSGPASSGGFYSGFNSAPNEIDINIISLTQDNCIPDTILEVANPDNFDIVEWFFDDGKGGGFISTGSNEIQYTPIDSRIYKVIGSLTCTGDEIESTEVIINDCSNNDLDDDGILDINECVNILLGNGFENISNLNFGNNIGVDISPWILGAGGQANVVKVDGADGMEYGNKGPFEDANAETASGIEQHYLDINVGSNTLYQVFILDKISTVTYSGYFSSRKNRNGTGRISIHSGNLGESGTLVNSSGTIMVESNGDSRNTPWKYIEQTVKLNPGMYSFVVAMNDYSNFDEAKLTVSCDNR